MTKLSKKKPYEGHEIVYRTMKKKGILVWGQKGSGSTGKSCHPETNNFLKDVLSQPWAPKSGKVIELGCGTGPILRRVCKRGFSGVGIDISKTAIAMAKEQSKGLDIKFRQGDVCNLNAQKLGKYDLVLDGLCLHCITDIKDRKAYLVNVLKLLKEGGLFVLLTMCGPMDRKRFSESCKGHKIVKKVVYAPFEDKSYERLARFNDKYYLPSRYIGHWKEILSELRRAGFELKLIRYNSNNHKDFCGTLTVGALK
jgi:2-polyprenyl-3-methyl-5-hydroxy-6-metoxy-1,4-benzoquinol methylase